MRRGRIVSQSPVSPPAQPGDLMFYVPLPGQVWEGVIASATGGPYCHVAVCLGDGQAAEALDRGVLVDVLAPGVPVATGGRCAQLTAGLEWVRKQAGKPYAYAQLVEDAELIVWHALDPSVSVGPLSIAVPPADFAHWFQPGAFDCSSLAARFLLVAEYQPLPGVLDANPDAMSPNSLARALGARW